MSTVDFEHRLAKLKDRIEENTDLSPENKEYLRKFSRAMKLNDYSDARNYKLCTLIKIIAENIDIDLKGAGKEDIERMIEWIHSQDFSPETKRDYKIALRVFYKWLRRGNFNTKEYPEEVDWINTGQKKKNEKLPSNLLTEKDVKSLINNATNKRCKALISILWETGARMGELMDLTPNHIDDHPHGYKVVIKGKTGPRRLPLITSSPYISSWLEDHPLRDSDEWPDVPLWSELEVQNHGNRGSKKRRKSKYNALKRDIERTAKRADIDKPVNPHHFRHSRATYMANRFTEAQMCEWFGWVPGSKMPGKYVHLAGRDIDNAYQQIHGLKEEKEEVPEMLPQECPRCELEDIEATAKFCPRCGQALTREAFQQVEEKKGAAEGVLEDLLSDLEFKKMISERIDQSIADKIENE